MPPSQQVEGICPERWAQWEHVNDTTCCKGGDGATHTAVIPDPSGEIFSE